MNRVVAGLRGCSGTVASCDYPVGTETRSVRPSCGFTAIGEETVREGARCRLCCGAYQASVWTPRFEHWIGTAITPLAPPCGICPAIDTQAPSGQSLANPWVPTRTPIGGRGLHNIVESGLFRRDGSIHDDAVVHDLSRRFRLNCLGRGCTGNHKKHCSQQCCSTVDDYVAAPPRTMSLRPTRVLSFSNCLPVLCNAQLRRADYRFLTERTLHSRPRRRQVPWRRYGRRRPLIDPEINDNARR